MSDFARSYSDGLKQMHDRRAKICEPCEFTSRDDCPGWYWPDISCPKALETWGEKPKRWEYGELKSERIMTKTFGLYISSDMDEFHNELSLYIGNLHQNIADHKETERNWLEQEKAYMSCIDGLKGFKIDAENMSKKLKAIEAWFESEKGYNFPGFEGLEEILGCKAIRHLDMDHTLESTKEERER